MPFDDGNSSRSRGGNASGTSSNRNARGNDGAPPNPNRMSDGWGGDYFDGGWNQGGWGGRWNQYDGSGNGNNPSGQQMRRSSLGYNDYQNNVMMQRNSLMGNMGGGVTHRGSMGFGYNGGGYNGYYFNQYGYQQQQGMNQGNRMNMNQDGQMNQDAMDNIMNPELNLTQPNANEADFSDPDEEDNIDYLAARAHAAQMLAQEESKRLEDNLKRLEARRKRGAMNGNKLVRKNRGGFTEGRFGPMSPQQGGKDTNMQMMQQQQNNQMQMMQQQNNQNQVQMMQQQNNQNQVQMMQQQNNIQNNQRPMQMQQPGPQDVCHPFNMNMTNNNMQNISDNAPNNSTNDNNIIPNTTNTNNSNISNMPKTQSKDDYLFERSRMNNFQMMRRASMDITMNMGFGCQGGGGGGGYHPMMPPNQQQMQNMMMQGNNNFMNNGAPMNDTAKKHTEKKRKRPTMSDPADLPIIPPAPPSPKKEVVTIRRPLSAYNIFFSEMRLILLKEDQAKKSEDGSTKGIESSADPSSKSITENESSNTTTIIDMKDFTKSLMEKRLNPPSTRRPHRKTHGAIGFTSLVQTISRKWKALPDEQKVKYQELAELDRERYKKDKAALQQRRKDEAKKARKMTRQLHVGGTNDDVV